MELPRPHEAMQPQENPFKTALYALLSDEEWIEEKQAGGIPAAKALYQCAVNPEMKPFMRMYEEIAGCTNPNVLSLVSTMHQRRTVCREEYVEGLRLLIKDVRVPNKDAIGDAVELANNLSLWEVADAVACVSNMFGDLSDPREIASWMHVRQKVWDFQEHRALCGENRVDVIGKMSEADLLMRRKAAEKEYAGLGAFFSTLKTIYTDDI